jgi:hypothetical protein
VLTSGADVAGSPQPGSPDGSVYTLTADTEYTVAADTVAGYTLSISGDCASDGRVTPAAGVQKSCTVTANDIEPATLKVVTRVVNDSGGTKGAGDFTVHVRRGGGDVSGSPRAGSAAGTTYTLAAGTYGVAAAAPVGYTAAIGGDCAASGAITLAAGAAKTCTITGDDKAVSGLVLPPPIAGKSVNAVPKSGTVKIKLPGTNVFVLLEEGQQIPVGTVIDATKGRVTLVAASNNSGGTATAVFYDGIFKVGQTKGAKPITTLKLVEKLSCGGGNASAAARRKKKRRLWGDGQGRFRTDGKYSAATVVGTKWLVEDRCGSTVTRVARGKVSVRDFAKKKTVTVKAGRTYVARAR